MREAVLTASMASGEAAVTMSTGSQMRWVMLSPCLAMISVCGCSTVAHSEPGPPFGPTSLSSEPGPPVGAARDW